MRADDQPEAELCVKSVARTFLDAIGREMFTFQTFDDNSVRRERSLARVLNGTIEKHFATLENLNRRGAGVFVTINRTDGKGRERHNIIGVRAVFVDLDGGPLAPVMRWALSPHIVVESSPGRYHAYWLVDSTVTPTDFGGLQKRLAKLLGGDPAVHDLPRVLRLPGFLHRKGRPFRTRIVHLNTTLPRYSGSELSTALADIRVNDVARECCSETPAIEPDQPGNIKAAIRYLKADASPAVARRKRHGDQLAEVEAPDNVIKLRP
jgi:RepB DNA-primase from phage plasmid